MAKLSVSFFEICDSALISRENKLSIIGIFDQIFSDQLPFNYLKFSLVSVISGDPDTTQPITIQIKDPQKHPVLSPQPIQVSFGPSGRSNFIFDYGNLKFSLSGDHTIELVHHNTVLAKKTFHVTKVNPQSNKPKTAD